MDPGWNAHDDDGLRGEGGEAFSLEPPAIARVPFLDDPGDGSLAQLMAIFPADDEDDLAIGIPGEITADDRVHDPIRGPEGGVAGGGPAHRPSGPRSMTRSR